MGLWRRACRMPWLEACPTLLIIITGHLMGAFSPRLLPMSDCSMLCHLWQCSSWCCLPAPSALTAMAAGIAGRSDPAREVEQWGSVAATCILPLMPADA